MTRFFWKFNSKHLIKAIEIFLHDILNTWFFNTRNNYKFESNCCVVKCNLSENTNESQTVQMSLAMNVNRVVVCR